jgi:hypothetical protein
MVACFLGAGAFVVVVIFCVLAEARRRRDFERRFPPISDAEFMERCSPGTSPEVALKVRRIVAENLGVEYDRIHPSCRFVEDLGG